MKGVVFTHFLDMVEATYGLAVVDAIIENCDLKSGGAYTVSGNYDFHEMLQLFDALSETVNVDTKDLWLTFGSFLFESLHNEYPEEFNFYKNPIGLLSSLEGHIKAHVRKLYPDAELPSFEVLKRTDKNFTIIYGSSKGLYTLIHGFIIKTFEHFQKSAQIDFELLNEQGTRVKFAIVQS